MNSIAYKNVISKQFSYFDILSPSRWLLIIIFFLNILGTYKVLYLNPYNLGELYNENVWHQFHFDLFLYLFIIYAFFLLDTKGKLEQIVIKNLRRVKSYVIFAININLHNSQHIKEITALIMFLSQYRWVNSSRLN